MRLGDALGCRAGSAEQIVGALGAQIEAAELERLRRRPRTTSAPTNCSSGALRLLRVHAREPRARPQLSSARWPSTRTTRPRWIYRRGSSWRRSCSAGTRGPSAGQRGPARSARAVALDPLGPSPRGARHGGRPRGAAPGGARRGRAVERGPLGRLLRDAGGDALASRAAPRGPARPRPGAPPEPAPPELYWLMAGFLQARPAPGAGRELSSACARRIPTSSRRASRCCPHDGEGDPGAPREIGREIRAMNPALSAGGPPRLPVRRGPRAAEHPRRLPRRRPAPRCAGRRLRAS